MRATREQQARRMAGRNAHIVMHGLGCCKGHAHCGISFASEDNLHTVFMYDSRYHHLIVDAIKTGHNINEIMVELSIQNSIRKDWPDA